MIRNSRRVVAFAIAGAFAVAPVISGCGAGMEPQSAAPSRLTEGVNASVPRNAPSSQVDIRNMFLLGPRPDHKFTPGASVPLYATLINQVKGRADSLVGVTSPDFSGAQITGGAVNLPGAQPSGEGTPVTLIGNAPAPRPTGSPSPTAQPTGTQSPRPTGSPTPTGSPSPTAEPTGTARPTGTASPEATGSPGPDATESPGAAASPTAQPTGTPTPPEGAATSQPENITPVQPGGRAPLVVLSGLNRELLPGMNIRVRLQFREAGGIDLVLPVIPQQGEYVSYAAVSPGAPVPPGHWPTAPQQRENGHGSH